MRTRGILPLCSALAIAILYAAPAYAQSEAPSSDNGVTFEAGLSQGHFDPNYGINFVPEKTVVQTEISYTHNTVTAVLRTFTVAEPERHQSLGDEQQFGLIYHDADHTRFGTFSYEGSVTYRALNMGHVSGTSDDYVEVAGRLAYPVNITGSWIVVPYAGLTKEIPVGHNNPLFFGSGGLLFCGPILSDAHFCIDAVSVHDVNSTTAVPHKNVWYVRPEVSRGLWYGIVGTVGFTYSQFSERDTQFEYIPQADGRLNPVPRLAKDRTRPGPKLFLQFSRHFSF